MKVRILVRVAGVALLACAIGLLGCQLSDSSGSISDSVTSSSDSISNSSNSSSASSSGDEGNALAAAFRRFTVAHLVAGGTPEELQRGLGDLAERQGVSDWEALPGNFVAIGRALAEAGVEGDDLDAYRETLAGSDADHRLAFARGYESLIR